MLPADARRTTRRAYGAGAVGVYGAPVYPPGCYQVAGPYDGVVTQCP
jgi:hypothetical protein